MGDKKGRLWLAKSDGNCHSYRRGTNGLKPRTSRFVFNWVGWCCSVYPRVSVIILWRDIIIQCFLLGEHDLNVLIFWLILSLTCKHAQHRNECPARGARATLSAVTRFVLTEVPTEEETRCDGSSEVQVKCALRVLFVHIFCVFTIRFWRHFSGW